MKYENEEWPLGVTGQIKNYFDFVAADAKYHDKCYLRFKAEKELFSNCRSSRGHTVNSKMIEYFNETCDIRFMIFKRK